MTTNSTDSVHRVTPTSHAVILDQLRADRDTRREMTPDEARNLGRELILAADQADPAGSEVNRKATEILDRIEANLTEHINRIESHIQQRLSGYERQATA